jgi:hypothetical protein
MTFGPIALSQQAGNVSGHSEEVAGDARQPAYFTMGALVANRFAQVMSASADSGGPPHRGLADH